MERRIFSRYDSHNKEMDKSTGLFDTCCFSANIKRGNYIFGIVNILLRIALIAPLWDLASSFEEDEGYRFLIKITSVWLLVSGVSAIIMMYGIWNHQPMHVLPFLIVVYCEFAFSAISTVALAGVFGSRAKTAHLASTMVLGWILTGVYLYYSFVPYRMYKQMLGNAYARYVYIA